MDIEIKNYQDLVSYCHLFHQQHIIDNQIDFAEFKNRLGWIDFTNNYPKFKSELESEEHANTIVQRVVDLLNTQQ